MSDHSELKRLAKAVASQKNMTIEDERRWQHRSTGESVLELFVHRDQLKTDNSALVSGIEHQCNWLQSLIDIGGKADADAMGAMLAKLRHELDMNKVYARG
ncbi:hypothetical protein [Pseudomonas koreensis]|uniref:hypothetical protein n=1 Tax=Pseudomonas koreensis TaxID=198620 RepID=UPI0020774BEA|nr:hypothetical protein [Pseudomonas koreensis]MCM8743604.1 hypothetical protein [Pseudomonas koreensis]